MEAEGTSETQGEGQQQYPKKDRKCEDKDARRQQLSLTAYPQLLHTLLRQNSNTNCASSTSVSSSSASSETS